MADEDQNYAVFNSRMLVDTVGDITDEALKASRIKDIIGVLAGRVFNWGQRKSLFPLHLGIKCLRSGDGSRERVVLTQRDLAYFSDLAPDSVMFFW